MSVEYQACICVACQQRIEFPSEMAAQTINCPTCSQSLILPAATESSIVQTRKSLFGGFMGMLGEIKERRDEIHRYRDSLAAFETKLQQVLADGELEAHEVRQLIEALEFYGQSGFGLSVQDAELLFLKVLNGIHWRNDTDQLTTELHDAFGLVRYSPAMQVAIARGHERLRIESGQLEPIHIPGVVMKREEQAFWSEPAAIIEDRVVRRRYEGGSQGMSVRVMKGVSFRVGATRGHYVSDVEALPISVGNLVLTNQRFYFAGDRKNFTIPLRDLAQVEFGFDTLTMFSERSETPKIVRFSSAERCDLFKLVLVGLSRRVASAEIGF